jgi:myxalamid-type nonribosomal peptide synthetase MxaA
LARQYVAPRTSTEELLAGIWAEVLGLERVGIHDNFFELGGHSLLVSRLGFKIRDTFKVDLPIRSIFKRPTISELAHLIRNDDEYGQYQTDKIINLDLEAKLDPAIRPSFVSVKQTLNPGVVLVTGATGFLGVFLVHELLQQTGAKIYCLVRAETIDSAWQKLKTQMSQYEVWDPHLCCRLVPVCGDLSIPYLGLPRHQFEELAREVEVIYHNGAQVNFVYPYHILKPANVLGTQEILRLACTNRLKAVHYVSALSVLRNETNLISEQITEDYFPKPNLELSNGYAQSKWVAEKLVRTAGDRGVPICIYRPGQISGHSYTGVCNTDDFMCRMIKSYVDLGKAPLEELILDMAPVDHVSKAIVFLSTRSASLGCTFHLNNPNLISTAHIINWFSSAGFVIKKVSFAEWWSEINVIVKDSYNHPLYTLISYFEDTSFDQQEISAQKVHYDCRKTLQALEGSGIVYPDVNDEIFHRYISYFIRSGFIKAPILRRSDFKDYETANSFI